MLAGRENLCIPVGVLGLTAILTILGLTATGRHLFGGGGHGEQNSESSLLFGGGAEDSGKKVLVKRLPDAIIIGVKKAGTRALLEYLRLHPKVRAPGPEIHFFDRYYSRGLEWYSCKYMANGDPEVNHFRTVYFPEGETATKKASAKTLWSLYEADCNRLHAVDVFPCRGDCDAPQPHSIFIHMTQPPKILMLIPNRKMVIPNDHGAFYTQKRHDYVIIQHHLSFQYTTQPKKQMPEMEEGAGWVCVEKTPAYFVRKEVPPRLYTMSPDTKLLVVVRDPVTRAISDYTQSYTKGKTRLRFEEMVFREGKRVETKWSGVRIGLYARHLRKWLPYFPLSQMHFVSGENLIQDPVPEMRLVEKFLHLPPYISQQDFQHNATKRFPCVKRRLKEGAFKCLGKTKGREHPVLPPTTLLTLKRFFHPHNQHFFKLVGRDFEWNHNLTSII